MRSLWAFGLLLVSLLAIPPAASQADASRQAIDDPVGDVQGPVPAAGAGFVDLTRAETVANESALDLRIQVAALEADGATGLGWELWLRFDYRGVAFDLVIDAQQSTAGLPPEVERVLFGTPAAARLFQVDPIEEIARLEAGFDRATRTFNVTMPWDLVADQDGFSPRGGEPVRLVEAASFWSPTYLGTPHNSLPLGGPFPSAPSDRAAFPDGTFLTLPGATGDVTLATPLPLRFSNGEATTVHWPITVTNQGDRPLDVRLALDAVGVQARVPPGVHLGPREAKTVSVFLSLPFIHEHGTTREFLLTADDDQGGRTALRLGVDYPSTPQPAGHHPEVWLHGNVYRIEGQPVLASEQWMNTLQEDERSDADFLNPGSDACKPGAVITGENPDFGFSWFVGLAPRLTMGLDGRVGETASLDVTLNGKVALPAGTLRGRLFLASQLSDTFGAFTNTSDAAIASAPVAATTGPGDSGVHLDLPIPPEMDLVPPARGENLVLGLIYCFDTPAPSGTAVVIPNQFIGLFRQETVSLRSGGHLVLPLDEYHDVIPVPEGVEGLALTVDEPVARAAAGATVLWTPTLAFPAGDDGRYQVRLFGAGAAHATLLASAEAAAGEPVPVPVSLIVPDEPAGSVVDLLLEVAHTTDPARSVALRLAVVVDPAATRDDAVAAAGLAHKGPKESPGVSLALLMATVALAAFARRRVQ